MKFIGNPASHKGLRGFHLAAKSETDEKQRLFQRDNLRAFLKALRSAFLVAIITLIAVVAYALGAANLLRKPANSVEMVQAVPPAGLVLRGPGTCVEPNERERALVKTAVDALAFSGAEAGFLSTGAQKLLSVGLYRRNEQESKQVCDIPEEYERAATLINEHGHFRRGRIVEYQLKLIAKLPHPSEDLVRAVAASAFSDTVQLSGTFRNRDIRPLARATLSQLGQYAKRYSDQAFELISIEDSLGTGAAQVAVAGGHPMALQTVERLMVGKLATLPRNHVVPRDLRDRMYEMAYALEAGGEKAKDHIAPLRDLMSRKVQSWAPPFGMIELPPRRMCRVLAEITDVPVSKLGFDYCKDLEAPYEQ